MCMRRMRGGVRRGSMRSGAHAWSKTEERIGRQTMHDAGRGSLRPRKSGSRDRPWRGCLRCARAPVIAPVFFLPMRRRDGPLIAGSFDGPRFEAERCSANEIAPHLGQLRGRGSFPLRCSSLILFHSVEWRPRRPACSSSRRDWRSNTSSRPSTGAQHASASTRWVARRCSSR